MSEARRFDADDVRAELTAEAVLDRYGWRYRRAGRWLRLVECPSCQSSRREPFAVRIGGGFTCHVCGIRGDLLDLVALGEGLHTRRDFQRVLEVAADIADVQPRERPLTAEERARRHWEREQRKRREARRRAQEERERLERAAVTATTTWDRLHRRHPSGEQYLAERDLKPAELVGRDLVRFDGRGTVRVALHDEQGRIVNVPGRFLPGSEPAADRKILNLTGCPTAGTFGDPGDVLHAEGPVVVVEGIMDFLSAAVIWPDRAILGAHGACNFAHAARVAAERVLGTDRELYLVPHPDDAGRRAAREAYRAIRAAGIPQSAGLPRDRIRALDTSAWGDLNDYLRGRQP